MQRQVHNYATAIPGRLLRNASQSWAPNKRDGLSTQNCQNNPNFIFPSRFWSEPSQLIQYQSNIHESQVCWLNPNYWNSKIWSTTLWVLSTQGPPSVSHCCRPHLATAQRSRHSTPRIAPVASSRQWADWGLKKRHKINGESRLPPMMAMITTYFK